MKKVNIRRFRTYSLMSLIAILGTTNPALTQVVKNSTTQPTPVHSPGLIWPTQGTVSQGFRKYKHEGIDIAGASGTPIVAAGAGIVVKAGWDDWGLGNAITIKHPDGSLTVYGHNRRLLVSKGKQVNQGQIIGEMGSTGRSTAPHLHFEFHPDGGLAVDPLSLLSFSTASKKPLQGIAQVDNPSKISILPITNPVSPSQPIPEDFIPVKSETGCNGTTVIDGETANIRVKVCQENGQLFYIGQLKQNSSQPVKIPAWNIGQDRYQADNGSFSYLVSSEKVEVWRNGNQIRSDNFYTFKRSQN